MSTQSKFDSVRIGEQLPGLNVPITASLIVAGAIATIPMNLGPSWYPIALMVTALPCAWLGGVLQRMGRAER